MSKWQAMVVVSRCDDETEAWEEITTALRDTSVYFVGNPWPVTPISEPDAEPEFDTLAAIGQMPL